MGASEQHQDQDREAAKPLPVTPEEWLREIALAYQDARETMSFGPLVGAQITPANLYHLAPLVCLTFRGVESTEENAKKSTQAALSSYVATRDKTPNVLSSPRMAFAFCYLASHFGLGLLGEEAVGEVMDYLEQNEAMLLKLTPAPKIVPRLMKGKSRSNEQ